MKRSLGVASILILCAITIYGLQPATKKKRCALEPCMDKKIAVSSPSFIKNSKIPLKHVFTQCGGQNVSPALSWQKITDAKSYMIIVQDPDAPNPKNPNPKPYIHWIAYNIPPSITSIESGINIAALNALQGKNDFGNARYDGPCPPQGSGIHRYFFKVFALDIAQINVQKDSDKNAIWHAAQNHIIASGEVIGKFELPSVQGGGEDL